MLSRFWEKVLWWAFFVCYFAQWERWYVSSIQILRQKSSSSSKSERLTHIIPKNLRQLAQYKICSILQLLFPLFSFDVTHEIFFVNRFFFTTLSQRWFSCGFFLTHISSFIILVIFCMPHKIRQISLSSPSLKYFLSWWICSWGHSVLHGKQWETIKHSLVKTVIFHSQILKCIFFSRHVFPPKSQKEKVLKCWPRNYIL